MGTRVVFKNTGVVVIHLYQVSSISVKDVRSMISTAPRASLKSFCERILSAANLILTEGNTLLSEEELAMMVLLHMNRNFMEVPSQNSQGLLDASLIPMDLPQRTPFSIA